MSGAIRVNISTLEASAVIQADSTTQGALFPRMTSTQRDAISSPANGLVIYNTTTGALNVYNGATWEEVVSGTSVMGDVSGGSSSTDNGIARYDGTSGKLIQDSTSTIDDNGAMVLQRGAVMNESGADSDTRVEGDTDQNLLFVDASTDRVGIGTATPAVKLDVNGATNLNGTVTMADNTLERPLLKDYAETLTTVAATGATETLDLESGNVFDITLDASCTLTFSNPPASGRAGSFTLIVRQNGTGGWTLTYPASVKWAGGTPPTLSTAASAIDILSFVTVNGGTTWFGFLAGLAFA